MKLEHGRLAIRPLENDDGPILYKWLNDPRVLAFYEGRDRPHSMDMVRERFLSKTGETLGCLLSWDGVPTGYVQIYPVTAEELVAYGYSGELRVYGMDQFIGEPDMWNQGVGTLLVRVVKNWLLQTCRVDHIVMDPRVDNLRAIHVYEKCGFEKRKLLHQRELHEGRYHDCWLMELSQEERL